MSDAIKTIKLKESSLSVADHKRTTYLATPEAGTNPDALLQPIYWSHVARKLRPLDKIEAVVEDGAWYQELIVIHRSDVDAKVSRLRLVKLDEVQEVETEGADYEAKWSGPVAKHRVIRKADGMVMKDGFTTKAEAMAFIETLRPKAA